MEIIKNFKNGGRLQLHVQSCLFHGKGAFSRGRKSDGEGGRVNLRNGQIRDRIKLGGVFSVRTFFDSD